MVACCFLISGVENLKLLESSQISFLNLVNSFGLGANSTQSSANEFDLAYAGRKKRLELAPIGGNEARAKPFCQRKGAAVGQRRFAAHGFQARDLTPELRIHAGQL